MRILKLIRYNLLPWLNTKFLQPILQGSCGSQRVNCTRDVFFNLKKINFLIFPIKPSIIMGNFLSVGSQSWLSLSNVDVFSLGFFFVYFVQNKPSNLPFISLMLWVEVNLGIFLYKRRNQINLFSIKIDGCFFFLYFSQFSWSICSWVNTYMVLLWEI